MKQKEITIEAYNKKIAGIIKKTKDDPIHEVLSILLNKSSKYKIKDLK